MNTSIRHVAIIMDGNGRWAKQRFRPRVWGHIRGSAVVSKIVESANKLNLKALTLYAFSSENWSRPAEEVQTLFKLLFKYLNKEKENIFNNNIQFKVIGNIDRLDFKTQKLIKDLENATCKATGLQLSFAFGYSGRQEIIDAVNRHINEKPSQSITEDDLTHNLYRPSIGDVDLLIRTAGDHRVSNFLLWQISYAELFFTNVKWPDFSAELFENIINEVSTRARRFGSLDNAGSLSKTKKLVNENLNKEAQ